MLLGIRQHIRLWCNFVRPHPEQFGKVPVIRQQPAFQLVNGETQKKILVDNGSLFPKIALPCGKRTRTIAIHKVRQDKHGCFVVRKAGIVCGFFLDVAESSYRVGP